MSALLRERAQPPARAPRQPRPHATDLPGSASAVLALQRSAGNSAVAQYLTDLQRPAPSEARAAASLLNVQRCGPVPCDCSGEERTAHATQTAERQGAGALTEEDSRPALQRTLTNGTVQRQVPGDGMLPPGDCSWGQYAALRLSVESAKAVVSMLGNCAPGDSCLFLATKIAAITAEIAARVALDTTCFRGGDTGHRQQVQDKINMMNRCYRFFQASNCSPELIAAMEVVVAGARAVIEAAATAAAVAVVVAVIVALVVAIIALIEVIAAAAAAAAEAAAIAAAAAAMAALLVIIKDNLPSGSTTDGA